MNKVFLFGAILFFSACVEVTYTETEVKTIESSTYMGERFEIIEYTTKIFDAFTETNEPPLGAKPSSTSTTYLVRMAGGDFECISLEECKKFIAQRKKTLAEKPAASFQKSTRPVEPVGAEN